jgi:hypothetical protein
MESLDKLEACVKRLNCRLGERAVYATSDAEVPAFPKPSWMNAKKKEVYDKTMKIVETEFVRLDNAGPNLVSFMTPYCDDCVGACAVQKSLIHPLDIWSMDKGGAGKGIVPCMNGTVDVMPLYEVRTYFYVSALFFNS